MKCIVKGCDNPASTKEMCRKHYVRQWRRGKTAPSQAGRCLNAAGYVKLRVDESGHPANLHARTRSKNKYVFEHRYVMEQHLGRKLLPGENVHHKNGDRTDNRIENLELWSKVQPPGQRVSDKVAWAIEILSLYKPEVLK